MVSRPDPSAAASPSRGVVGRSDRSVESPRARKATREAVREIVRRYRETFERLGR